MYKDGDVCMDATHTDTSISYEFKAQSQRSEVDHLEFSIQDSHIDLSPERIAIYGDSHWRLTILKALNSAVLSLSLYLSLDIRVCITCTHVMLMDLLIRSHVIAVAVAKERVSFVCYCR